MPSLFTRYSETNNWQRTFGIIFYLLFSKTFAKTSILFFKQFIYTYINRYKSSDQRHPSILYAMFYFLTILSLFLQQNVNVNHFSSVSAIIFFIF